MDSSNSAKHLVLIHNSVIVNALLKASPTGIGKRVGIEYLPIRSFKTGRAPESRAQIPKNRKLNVVK